MGHGCNGLLHLNTTFSRIPLEVFLEALNWSQPLSTFFRQPASYLWGRPSSRNVLHLAFDRVSVAWDNLGFWGYDETSTDYSRRSIDRCFGFGCHGTSATRATYRPENRTLRKRLVPRRSLL